MTDTAWLTDAIFGGASYQLRLVRTLHFAFRSATAQPCSPYRYGARNFFAVYVNRLLKGVDIVVYILGVMRYGVAILCYGVGCDALFDVRYFMKLWY